MWTWFRFIYIWSKALKFTVQTVLVCMWHLPGSTAQAANSCMICTYLKSLLPTTLVLCYPRMEWPSSRMGWPYDYIGRILLMLAMSRVDAQSYQNMLFLDILDSLAVFVWKKLKSWWVAHWLPSQIRVPLVVTTWASCSRDNYGGLFCEIDLISMI